MSSNIKIKVVLHVEGEGEFISLLKFDFGMFCVMVAPLVCIVYSICTEIFIGSNFFSILNAFLTCHLSSYC
jgi:hypothetical protein